MISAGILGLGRFLPERVFTNDDFVKMGMDTSDDWITSRTGIKERRLIADDMSTSDMAVIAAKAAIADAKLSPQDIDLIIVATTSQDYPGFPSVACLVQHKLGIPTVGAFDVAAACTGFNYALTTATQYVATEQAKHVLVIGADCLSRYVDWTDRSICILFGDGAGAAVVGPVPAGHGILSSKLYADGSLAEILCINGGGSKNPFSPTVLEEKSQYIYMNGRAVFKAAVNAVVDAIETALDKANLSAKDIDFFVPHQANIRIIDHCCDKLGLSKEQTIVTLDRYGNTSAASIPISMTEAREAGKISDGDIIATIGFGAGFTWGTNIIKWSDQHA